MRLMNVMKLGIAVLSLFFVSVAHADGAPSDPNYIITFTTVFTSVTGSTETLSGSFDYIFSAEADGYILDPGTGNITSSGFLGTFTDPVQDFASYMAFFGTYGDEIDLYLYGPPTDLNQFAFYLYNCASVECDDAYPSDSGYGGKPATGTTYSVVDPPSSVPEPASWAMLAMGLIGLAVVKRP